MHVLGLAAFVLAIALAISRIGLVLHELVGHGVIALAIGGDVTGWSLHTFGGGWIGYDRGGPPHGAAAHLVQLGGLAVELLAAAACALVSRRTVGLVRLGFAASACALAIHAGWYLAAGTFHGFGDGWLLHRQLGDARLGIVVPVALVTIAATFLAARHLAGALRGVTAEAKPRRQLAAVAAALALGLGGHAALTVAELQLRPDRTYQATMRTAGQRAADRALAQRVATAERAGRPLDVRAVRAARRELERQHRQFPFGPALIGALALAAIAGVAVSRAAPEPSPMPRRAIAIAALIALASIALVVGLDIAGP